MSRPTRALLQAVASASQPRTAAPLTLRPKRVFLRGQDIPNNRRDQGQGGDAPRRKENRTGSGSGSGSGSKSGDRYNRSTNLVIRGIPRTALPEDVLRALQERDLVPKDFSLSNITPFPKVCQRQPSLAADIHISLPDHASAVKTVEYSQKNTLFPLFLPGSFRVDLNQESGQTWTKRFVNGFNKSLDRDERGYVDPEWVSELGKNGRRVLIKGLPSGMSDVLARRWFEEEWSGGKTAASGAEEQAGRRTGGLGGKQWLAKDKGLMELWDGVKKLPQTPGGKTATFVLGFKTVTDATRAARNLNMTQYSPPVHDGRPPAPPYLIRAEVIW